MGNDVNQLTDALTDAWASSDALVSPKLSTAAGSTASWYRYYAGYADAFVADVVRRLPEGTGSVLDPWNGSGTTTSIASAHGIDAQGFDANPAAVVIAKARVLQSEVAPSLLPLTRELLAALEPDAQVSEDDLLLQWMTPRGARAVRRVGSTIDRVLVEPEASTDAPALASGMSPLAAVVYLALFRAVRGLLTPFAGTNPTWLRRKVPDEDKLDLDLRTLRPALLRVMGELTSTVKSGGLPDAGHGRIEIAVADSGALPVADGSVEAVITSPPYCTRIDYAVATLPELAVLGVSTQDFRRLRDRLIGTPTRDGTFAISDARWGEAANRFLSKVADHDSYASVSYYLPFFSQYFAGMWRSLAEMNRAVASGRPIVLVVQDSYFKDVHADIPAVMTEMADGLGWKMLARRNFQVKTKANINAGTRKYRDAGLATEAVLAFSR